VALSGALGAFVLEPMPSSLWLGLLAAGSCSACSAPRSPSEFLRV
jgi:hypothetical protein